MKNKIVSKVLRNLNKGGLINTVHLFAKKNFKFFEGFKFIRSAELIYVAYKKNVTRIKDGKDVLDALLYAVKFSGCAISGDEIKEMKRIV